MKKVDKFYLSLEVALKGLYLLERLKSRKDVKIILTHNDIEWEVVKSNMIKLVLVGVKSKLRYHLKVDINGTRGISVTVEDEFGREFVNPNILWYKHVPDFILPIEIRGSKLCRIFKNKLFAVYQSLTQVFR